jgi:hypothetical protein
VKFKWLWVLNPFNWYNLIRLAWYMAKIKEMQRQLAESSKEVDRMERVVKLYKDV